MKYFHSYDKLIFPNFEFASLVNREAYIIVM